MVGKVGVVTQASLVLQNGIVIIIIMIIINTIIIMIIIIIIVISMARFQIEPYRGSSEERGSQHQL